jgi:hypothetical protein
MLCFLHFSSETVQLSARWYPSLPSKLLVEHLLLPVPLAVVLIDSNIASLPVYPLTLAFNPFDSIFRDGREIYCRIELFRVKSLITY